MVWRADVSRVLSGFFLSARKNRYGCLESSKLQIVQKDELVVVPPRETVTTPKRMRE